MYPLASKYMAQKPYIVGSLGPKALKYESFEGKGTGSAIRHYKGLGKA